MRYYFTKHLIPDSQVKYNVWVCQRWLNIAKVFGKSNNLALRGAAKSWVLLSVGVVSGASQPHPAWRRALHRDRRCR